MSLVEWIPVFGPRIARKRAFRELPELAGRWGLEVVESEYRDRFGSIEGVKDGYRVSIEPDESRARVYFNRELERLYLDTWDDRTRNNAFDTGHKRFDRVFKTRKGSSGQQSILRSRPDLLERLVELRRRRWVTQVSITEGYALCCLGFRGRGSGADSYISVDLLEPLIPEMIDAAGELEAALSRA